MNYAGTYEVDIEVRRVGQAIPPLEIFCDGCKMKVRQDVALALAFVNLSFIVKVYASRKSTHLCTRLLLSNNLARLRSGMCSVSSSKGIP